VSFPLTNLDDRTYAELIEEGQALIPTYAPAWTNHNPSDPGITLMELCAWLTEMLIYRVNRVPDAQVLAFLRLLNGPGWQPSPDMDLAEEIRLVVLSTRQRYRAVTAADYALLATDDFNQLLAEAQSDMRRGLRPAAWQAALGLDRDPRELAPSSLQPVARAYVAANRDLEFGTDGAGNVSVVILPAPDGSGLPAEDGPRPDAPLCEAVWRLLDQRRLLGSSHHVVGPVYACIAPRVLVACRADAPPDQVRQEIDRQIRRFLDPLVGGDDRQGWPFGRPVYVSELFEQLVKVPGVKLVADVSLRALPPRNGRDFTTAVEVLSQDEEQLVGLDPGRDHLPWPLLDDNAIVVSAHVVPLYVTVDLSTTLATGVGALQRSVKTVIADYVRPPAAGTTGAGSVDFTTADVRRLVRALAGVDGKRKVGVELRREADAPSDTVTLHPPEVADLRLTVQVR
jgi:hypothetical protein